MVSSIFRKAFVFKPGVHQPVADVNVCVLSHQKEELAWAADKRLWVIYN